MTPFHRLGLYTAGAIVAGAIAYVADVVSLWVGVASLIGGAILALVSTFEARAELPPVEIEEATVAETELAARRDRVTRGRTRSDIARSAERSREDLENRDLDRAV